MGKEQVCLQLREGSISNRKMVQKFAWSSPTFAFSDVRHDGD